MDLRDKTIFHMNRNPWIPENPRVGGVQELRLCSGDACGIGSFVYGEKLVDGAWEVLVTGFGPSVGTRADEDMVLYYELLESFAQTMMSKIDETIECDHWGP